MVAASRVRNKELGITRPPSSWAIFVKEKQQEYQRVEKSKRVSGKTMSQKPTTSTLAKLWKEMTETAKAPSKIKANELAQANAGKREAALAEMLPIDIMSLKPSVYEGKCFPRGLEDMQIHQHLGRVATEKFNLQVCSEIWKQKPSKRG